jgi:hypothetical protein
MSDFPTCDLMAELARSPRGGRCGAGGNAAPFPGGRPRRRQQARRLRPRDGGRPRIRGRDAAVIGRRRPQDAILGEEFAATAGTSGLTWVLDPIDGTRGYLSGTPTWGVLVAVSDAGGPIFGVIDQPYIGERFIGGFGRASHRPRGRTPLARGRRARWPRRSSSPPSPRSGPRPSGRLPARRRPGAADALRHGLLRLRACRRGADRPRDRGGVAALRRPAPIAVIEAAGGHRDRLDGRPGARRRAGPRGRERRGSTPRRWRFSGRG